MSFIRGDMAVRMGTRDSRGRKRSSSRKVVMTWKRTGQDRNAGKENFFWSSHFSFYSLHNVHKRRRIVPVEWRVEEFLYKDEEALTTIIISPFMMPWWCTCISTQDSSFPLQSLPSVHCWIGSGSVGDCCQGDIKTHPVHHLMTMISHWQVSWIRHRDIHLLTTGKHTYTSDLRFQSIHNPQTEDWSLQVSTF